MRLVFAGSPPFATPILRALLESRHRVLALVTPPDRPRGRGQRVATSPLAEMAAAPRSGVEPPEVLRTANANDEAVLDRLESLRPDAMVVASFGQLLGERFLALAPSGALNVHASLLPKHRGAAPVAAAIAAGDAETGVSIQRIVKKLDAGPVCARAATAIDPAETAGALTARLAELGAETLLRALDDVEAGRARFEAQDEASATYARKLSKESGRIEWTRRASDLARFVRAMTPWPGAWTELRAGEERRRLRVLAARAKDSSVSAAVPGTILAAIAGPAGELAIATASGALVLEELQPEGGRVMSASEFLRGRPLDPGAHLTS